MPFATSHYSISSYIVFIISGYQRQPQYSRQHIKRQNFRMFLQSWSCIHYIHQMRLLHRQFYSIVIIIIIALNQVAAHKRNAIHSKNYISKVSSKTWWATACNTKNKICKQNFLFAPKNSIKLFYFSIFQMVVCWLRWRKLLKHFVYRILLKRRYELSMKLLQRNRIRAVRFARYKCHWIQRVMKALDKKRI